MRRLFYGNFDFEHELANPNSWQRSPAIQRMLAERASVWIGLANDGDLIWTPEAIPDSFWEELANVGLPRIQGVAELKTFSDDNIELVPWGCSRRTLELSRRPYLQNEAAALVGNSRKWSFALEQELGVALPGAARIERLEDFLSTVETSANLCGDRLVEHRWVIKSNYGMAARERILGLGPMLSVSHQQWIHRHIAADDAVFFEPWIPILEEVGLQFSIPPRTMGAPRLEGITPLLSAPQGGYRGSRFSLDEAIPKTWQSSVELALQAAKRLQHLGYVGPLGIDAAQHELPTGDVVHRPLQDINVRFTMGRLALGFKQLLRKAEFGVWQHITINEKTIPRPSPEPPTRTIKTSPKIVGTMTANHLSEILIYSDNLDGG
ncbi:MAG: hypothetical protein NT013_28640 [Planctomycetia bacterium]|nr:hypothetical protein [Planctomycetia bacterium]